MNTTGRTTARDVAAQYDNHIIWRRFLSYLIDTGAVILCAGIAGAPLPTGHQLPLVAGAVLATAYFVVLEGFYGCSLGRLATFTRVVDQSGMPPGLLKALIRTALRFLEANPLPLGGAVAGLVAGYTPARQRVGDLLAQTYVLRTSDLHLVAPESHRPPSSRDWMTRFEDWQRRNENA